MYRLKSPPNLNDLLDEYEDLPGHNVCDKSNYESRNQLDVSFINPEVYLSLVWHSGNLGIAYYDASSHQIYVMADVPENSEFVLLKQIIREIQPRVILLSSVHDSGLLACLKKEISDKNPMNERTNTSKLEFMPNSDFNYEVSKHRILCTQLPSVPKHFSDEEKKLYFASLLGLDNTRMVRSLGGLLKYLDKMRVGVELEDVAIQVPILGFQVFTLESQVQVDMRTYLALNIFSTELHPSGYRFGTTSSKEGLSLFGILNRCKSSIGSKMLRQWFLRPLRNASVLRQRYSAVSFFLKPTNVETMSCIQGCLKHIKYLPRILSKMSAAQATIGDWIALSKTLYHAVYIGEICRTLTKDVDIFRKIGMAFTDELHRCYNLLCKTIDFEASKQNNRFVVQANVDAALDAKKHTFNGLPDLMSRVAREELNSLSHDIKACVVSYLPQIGYLLVIDMPEGKTEQDDHTISGLEFKFASDNQLFYKSPRTLELDRMLGDTQLEILDMEVAIMHHLQDTILEKTQLMLDVMELASELDCLMALATCASEFGFVCPTLIEEAVLDIKKGRHPLQELCCSPYVPNHTNMGGQHTKMKLLTGPNACGKSVYLKQVGLIVFMAHIGSFVPAEKARIGPVDKIFTCIKTVESVSGGLSAFMQENVQVSEALRLATCNSLVLLDEFGKGTEATDGIALLTAVIKFWIAKGSDCPLLLVSTHFHSIIQQQLLPPSTQLQFLTFDTVMNGEELVFLYQMKEGHTSSSYAFNIALNVGLPQAIVKRAKQVSDLLLQNKPIPRLKDASSDLQNERYEKIVSAFLKLDLDTDDLQAFLKGYVLPLCSDPQQKPQTVIPSNIMQPAPEVVNMNQNCINALSQISKGSKVCDREISLGNQQRSKETSNEPVMNRDDDHKVKHYAANKDKQNSFSRDQGLQKEQESKSTESLRSSNCRTRDVTKNQSIDMNTSFWKNLSGTLKEQFIRTPLVDKSGRKNGQPMSNKSNICVSKECTPGQTTVLDTTRHKPSEDSIYVSESNKPEKRKADMRQLFTSVTKQTKALITSSPVVNRPDPGSKQPSEMTIAQTGTTTMRPGRENISSSSISPASESYSEAHARSCTTHITSTDSQQEPPTQQQ
ncbi:hypothetical protein BsWGS_02637 [Bradybaena similaris]